MKIKLRGGRNISKKLRGGHTNWEADVKCPNKIERKLFFIIFFNMNKPLFSVLLGI